MLNRVHWMKYFFSIKLGKQYIVISHISKRIQKTASEAETLHPQKRKTPELTASHQAHLSQTNLKTYFKAVLMYQKLRLMSVRSPQLSDVSHKQQKFKRSRPVNHTRKEDCVICLPSQHVLNIKELPIFHSFDLKNNASQHYTFKASKY